MSDDAHSGGKSGLSDVVPWGIAALVCGAFAVFSANVAGFIPGAALSGLHATRIQAASVHQVRTQVLDLRQENARLAGDSRTLQTRFNLLEDDSSEVVRRLAAVEKSLPLLIESLPLSSDIDRSMLTASIGAVGGEVYDVQGGTIVVRHSPLFGTEPAEVAIQPLPAALPEDALVVLEAAPMPGAPTLGDPAAFGVAIGPALPIEEADAAYRAMASVAGGLLLGTTPLLADGGREGETRIVMGPLPDDFAAEALCNRLVRLEIACDPAPYHGSALSP